MLAAIKGPGFNVACREKGLCADRRLFVGGDLLISPLVSTTATTAETTAAPAASLLGPGFIHF